MRRACVLAVIAAGCGEPSPVFAAPMTLSGVEVSAEVLNQGARVYMLRCASCHGNDGSGTGAAGKALKEPPRDFRKADFEYVQTPGGLPTDEELAYTIRKGRIEEGMPGWPGMSDADVHAVSQYIKTFSPAWQGG